MKLTNLFRLMILLLSVWSSMVAGDEAAQLVTVQLKWKHQFQFAGFYAAAEKGYYRDIGLKVDFREAGPDTNPILEVLDGHADYGVANSELLLYKMQGKDVTALAVIVQHSPLVLLTLPESNILSPQDLVGRKVMYPDGFYGANTLGILKKEGVDPTGVIQVPLSFDMNDLVDGKVDAMTAYITDQPYQLVERGIEYRVIEPRHYGIDFYGDTLFTSQAYINSHPEQVKAFRAATLKGWQYAVKHPQEIAELIITKYGNRRGLDHLLYEAEEMTKLIVPDLVEIGHMNAGRWQYIAQTFVDLGLTNENYSLDGFLYDPDIDPELASMRRLLWSMAFVGGGVAFIALFLFLFNRRLKTAVELRTLQLSTTNQQLLGQTERLTEAQQALEKLNQELEQRVAERTDQLEQSNQDLMHEINERKERELSLRLLSRAVENSGNAVIITNKDAMIEYANPGFRTMTGFSADELVNAPLSLLISDSRDGVEEEFDKYNIQKLGTIKREVRCSKKSGDHFWAQLSVSPIYDDDNGISNYVAVCEDITLLKERKEEMERLAFYDPLTGLENRLLFKLRLEKSLAKCDRDNSKLAILFIDIDHFKRINDKYGHDAGDRVLKTIADRLKPHLRKQDSFARISGDEFTILLNDIHRSNDVRVVVSNMLNELKSPIKLMGHEFKATVSIGVTIAPDDGRLFKDLMKNADLAMYRAKRLGRNDFQFFSEDMNEEMNRNIELEEQISKAIEEEEFFLLFQPQICLKTKRLIGIEALVRWNHPQRGVLAPIEFINFAEESGLVVPLGRLIHKEAFRAGAEYLQRGLGEAKISINLSARQLYDPNLLEDIEHYLKDFGIRGESFEFEITETSLVERMATNVELLSKIKELGFTLAIDDFGTGYSSLSYIKQLPIDRIKIDKSFISDIPDDVSDVEITSAVIAMAHKLNLEVVAEGVETVAQEQFLLENNCDFVQGFFYDRPMRLDEIIAKYGTGEGHVASEMNV